ncbi:MAG: hypothetical protein PHE50_07270 [Dehalococcoidales bacterium]|nr:hypothetical protein [Dehalococcoidales bacterium]
MQNESLSKTNRKTKRKRGGQRGNQNARVHGFYSTALSPAEISDYWNIVNREHVAPEIAVIRLKLRAVLQRHPVNRRALAAAVRLLVTWLQTKYRLNDEETVYLKKFLVRLFLNKTIPALSSLASPVPLESDFVPNESGVLLQSNKELSRPSSLKPPFKS